MNKNLGKTQRILRLAAGTILIAVGIVSHNWILAAIGALPLLGGIVGYCPLCNMKKGCCSTGAGEKKEQEKGGCCGIEEKTEEKKGGCCGH